MGKEIKLNHSGLKMGIYTFGELLSDPHTRSDPKIPAKILGLFMGLSHV